MLKQLALDSVSSRSSEVQCSSHLEARAGHGTAVSSPANCRRISTSVLVPSPIASEAKTARAPTAASDLDHLS